MPVCCYTPWQRVLRTAHWQADAVAETLESTSLASTCPLLDELSALPGGTCGGDRAPLFHTHT